MKARLSPTRMVLFHLEPRYSCRSPVFFPSFINIAVMTAQVELFGHGDVDVTVKDGVVTFANTIPTTALEFAWAFKVQM